VLAAEAALLAVLGVVALDLVAHRHVEQLGGVNVWGYRGPVMHRKQAREIRIAVVGGDLAFGWGVAASEALAPTIRQFVALETDKPGRPLRQVTAVTIAAMGLAVRDYAGWIAHYSSLDPDVVCIVLDPVSVRQQPRAWPLPERRSLAWKMFGYAPILPLVLEEKGILVHSSALQTAGSVAASIDRGMARLVSRPSTGGNPAGSEIGADAYASGIEAAVRSAQAVGTGVGVVIVAPLYRSDEDARYHVAIQRMIDAKFSGDRRVQLVDLGDEPDMYDEGLRLNATDFSTAGHLRAAGYVTPAVLRLIEGQS